MSHQQLVQTKSTARDFVVDWPQPAADSRPQRWADAMDAEDEEKQTRRKLDQSSARKWKNKLKRNAASI